MEEIDYFKGVTNQQFIDYYKLDLFSRMEIILYTYPNERTEEEPIPWEHFNRCEGILYEYLYNAYAEAKFQRWEQQKSEELEISSTDDQHSDSNQIEIEQTAEQKAESYKMEQEKRNTIVRAKMQELNAELTKIQDDYLEKVKLTLIDL
ncbi:hypothetical protein B0A79_12275 [Flavobacterium piscis]|uniref:Uncharacterized protein n=1 Tax=Flavobacterium piscis TaxID=1114874 RepID=A0ABX2XRY1_9FLAO|nr:hypothetical protein [Flavobacterium piscis]OCB78319.1 hypothetical protein FLP_01045 [Flavobacterium piscis]OXG04241.1 hypothetical protein B0A79_12275 [Flavobacterium piscis]